MMLPGFGFISEIIAVMSRKPVFGYRLMALSLLAILILGFSVWAHHMFVAGMAEWLKVPMMVSTKLESASASVHSFSDRFFSSTIVECMKAVAVSQGMKEAFSTGSHAQYPPQPSTA